MKFKLSQTLAIPAFVTLLLLSPAALATTVLYSTNFNSPTYSDGGLIGQDSWVITGTSVVSPITVANTAVNGTVTLTTTGQDVRRAFAAQSADSIFLKANITVGTAQATGDYFIHLGDNGANNFFARTYIKSSGAGFQLALGMGPGTTETYGAGVLLFATSYTILVRYDFIAGITNNTGALFVNPITADGSGETAYVAATSSGTDATSISSVGLRQGATGSAPGGVVIDNISVSFIPEPCAAVLGSLGLTAILRRRRL
jgi:trimeric autotransporter adhesin